MPWVWQVGHFLFGLQGKLFHRSHRHTPSLIGAFSETKGSKPQSSLVTSPEKSEGVYEVFGAGLLRISSDILPTRFLWYGSPLIFGSGLIEQIGHRIADLPTVSEARASFLNVDHLKGPQILQEPSS